MFIVASIQKLTRHAKKRENVSYNQEKTQSIETAGNVRGVIVTTYIQQVFD